MLKVMKIIHRTSIFKSLYPLERKNLKAFIRRNTEFQFGNLIEVSKLIKLMSIHSQVCPSLQDFLFHMITKTLFFFYKMKAVLMTVLIKLEYLTSIHQKLLKKYKVISSNKFNLEKFQMLHFYGKALTFMFKLKISVIF